MDAPEDTPEPARKRPGAYHHGRLREAALAAGLELIREAGGPSFSLREVAGRLGVGHSALYRHFQSRQALLVAIATQGFGLLHASQQAALAAAPAGGRARLEALCHDFVRFALAHPAEYRAMFNPVIGAQPDRDDTLRAASRPTLDTLVAAVAAAQAEGTIAPADPAAVSGVVWAMVHGLSLLLLDRQIDALLATREALLPGMAERATTAVLDGLSRSGPGLDGAGGS